MVIEVDRKVESLQLMEEVGQKAISLAVGNGTTAAQKSAKPAGSKKPRVLDFSRTKVSLFEITCSYPKFNLY